MKRLTRRGGLGWGEHISCFGCRDMGGNNEKCGMCEVFTDVIGKLAEYEDTGLRFRP